MVEKTYQNGETFLDGSAVPCPRCRGEQYQAQRLSQRLSETSRVPNLYKRAAVSDLPAQVSADVERVLADRNGHAFLSVSGGPGIGKTHLLCAVVQRAITLGRSAVYTSVYDVLQHMRRAFANGESQRGDLFYQNLLTCNVLALDEIDRFNATEFSGSLLFDLLNKRYESGKGVTVLAGNNDLRQSDLFGEMSAALRSRIYERGVGNVAIVLEDIDRRSRGAHQERLHS